MNHMHVVAGSGSKQVSNNTIAKVSLSFGVAALATLLISLISFGIGNSMAISAHTHAQMTTAINQMLMGSFGLRLGFLLAIPAVICGHIGYSKSKNFSGAQQNKAITGLTLGYVSIALFILIFQIF